MKNRSVSQTAFFYVRTSIGVLFVLAGLFLGLLSFGQFSAKAQRSTLGSNGISPLVPAGFDCAQIRNLGINVQENLRAGAIMIACGQAVGGYQSSPGPAGKMVDEMSAPLIGGTDVDLVNGPETFPYVTQSETFVAANPDKPKQIVVAYNDSRGVNSRPISISSASVSTDGGATFTRITKTNGQGPFPNTFGDPVALYNRQTATWFAIWLDAGCGSQGIGGYKSTNPSNPNSWTHFCVHTGSADDRESGATDQNPTSPFYGRMYVSWNDFAVGGNLKVRSSSDGGVTWTEVQLAGAFPFIRDVQLTVDAANGNVFVAGMDEGGGGFNNRINRMYRSTDGGVTWALTYTGPAFSAPGRALCPNSYFVCMFGSSPGYWRHMGWGQPAAFNGVVHYVYDAKVGTDPANVFYIRSTDNGVTFSSPVQLNTDTSGKLNWQPNLSIDSTNNLLAVWYDERNATATCVQGSTTVLCYQMYAARSTDGGVTWGADSTFSDVVSPLPGQPDPGIVTEYVGDYDYSYTVGREHLHAWVDGRVPINGASQQDAFFDRTGRR